MTPEEVRGLWVQALRSGDYKQVTGRLTRVEEGETRHCCLGVLCELAADRGIVTRELVEDSSTVSYRAVGDSQDQGSSYLPLAVQRWAGLERSNPRTLVPLPDAQKEMDGYDPASPMNTPTTCTLGFLNDQLGYSFADIAGVVERDFGIAEVDA